MLADALRTLYRYNRWATERVLDAAERLTLEQLLTPGQAGHGSVRDTLVHLLRTQKSWLSWWDGSLPAHEAYALRLEPADYPDVGELRRLWLEVERQTEAFVAGLADADAARTYTARLPDGSEVALPLWLMMQHVANHGTQHRSEAAALLTGFGQSPGELDLIFYHFAGLDQPAGAGARGAE